MYELPVRGEIKTLGVKEGSSGIFTGTIEGLYQGYRFGSTTPDVQHHVLQVNNGTLALTLKQEIRSVLSPRAAEHPFAGGKDPFAGLSAPPPGMPGGPPPGAAGPPPGVQGGAPPGAGGAPAGLVRGRPFYMEVTLAADPERSTGIFAGATGQMELAVPNYRMAGHLVIETKDGDLRLDFLEAGEHGVLNADLWVNGEESTGLWRNARGDLKFSLTPVPPNFGRGPYWGTIWLEREPARDA